MGFLTDTPFVVNVGNGSAGPYPVEHTLGTRNFIPVVARNAGHVDNGGSGEIIYVDVLPVDENNVSVVTSSTWGTDQMRLMLYPVGGDDIVAPATPTLAETSTDTTSISVSATGTTAASYVWLLDEVAVARTAGCTHTYSSLVSNTEYDCAVIAYDLLGNSAASSTVAITTDVVIGDTAPPAAGTLTFSSKNANSITYTFTSGSDNVGVTQVDAYDATTDALIDDNVTSPWTRTGLSENTSYSTKMRYRDAATNTADSNTVTQTTDSSVVPITFIAATGVKDTSTLSPMPTHLTGDLLIMRAYRDGFTTPPSLPAGWTDIISGGADSNGMRVAYKVAASSSEVSGSWSNCTNLVCAVYRHVVSIGASAQNGSTTDPVTIPALTLQVTDGTSWVACGAGHRSGANSLATAPSGLTFRAGYEGSSAEQDLAAYDTNGGVSSFTSKTIAYATTSGWRTTAIELRAS